jgi:TPR repeat protein
VCTLLLSAASAAAQPPDAAALAREAAQGSSEARAQLERMAQDGSPLAEHLLGLMHLTGKGALLSEPRARERFVRAAEMGHVDSAHNAGFLFDRPVAPGGDAAQARRWYRFAAE